RFLEVGPKATLLGLVPACLPEDAQKNLLLLSSLREGRPEPEAICEALGGYHAHGGVVDWTGVFPQGGQRVALPTYPWQRQRYWLSTRLHPRSGEATDHPLLGSRVSMAGPEAVYETILSLAEHPWLEDHRIAGEVIVAGTVLAELVRAAGEQ